MNPNPITTPPRSDGDVAAERVEDLIVALQFNGRHGHESTEAAALRRIRERKDAAEALSHLLSEREALKGERDGLAWRRLCDEYIARAKDAEAELEAAREALKDILSVAPRLPALYGWTDLSKAEDLFDAELRHANGKTPVDYLRAWLSMLRPFAFATKDDSWGEMEKLLCIVMRNYVRVAAAAGRARASLSKEGDRDD